MNTEFDVSKLLPYIDPRDLDYTQWLNVGMALKHEGFTASIWDEWSKGDTDRYHLGECYMKWASFTLEGSGGVTGATITQFAKDGGWTPEHRENNDIDGELDWDSTIGGHSKDNLKIVDKTWLEGKEIIEPDEKWNPINDMVKYLETLFDSTENVGYVTTSWHDAEKNKHMPTKGNWDRTAGQLIQELKKCKGDIGKVLGDYDPDVGAWIRFNPLDGKGVKNENVTDFKYALVESDALEIDKQNALIRELELPVACLVHSGKKSVHAIVRVDAADYAEYRKRVDYLYTVCKKNGLLLDTQNKNPSRLSRLPGVMRSDKKQFLIDTNIGKPNWAEWFEWIEGVNDDLPDPESLSGVWDSLPDLAPTLIDGILRQGHKMLLAGPSKAAKSYGLIELTIAIAEGERWIGFPCAQGRILYVNLELDRASCLHRFKDVYQGLGLSPKHIDNIDIWNLRGRSLPMDKLAPKLIRRAAKKDYLAVIIDPIYKVITGDENSADQMAAFCNQFDRVCTDLGAAVIYCHHHSKGAQGGKRSMDRASGSGVFARDPDALLDLIELEVTPELIKQEENKAVAEACRKAIEMFMPDYLDNDVSQDDICSESVMLRHCEKALDSDQTNFLMKMVHDAKMAVSARSAWRIEGTLREFPKFKPVNLWFDYPVHHVDGSGSLSDIQPEDVKPPWQKATEARKAASKEAKNSKKIEFEEAFRNANFEGNPTKQEVADYLNVEVRTVERNLKKYGFSYDKNTGKLFKTGEEREIEND